MKYTNLIFFLLCLNFNSNFSSDSYISKIELTTVNDTLTAVKILNIDTVFPKYIFSIHPIYRLIVNNSYYKNLPIRIRDLVDLKELILRDCYNLDFQESFRRLRYNNNLTKLDLQGNKLREIPSAIKYLVNLEELDLKDNNLTAITKSVFRLKKLKKLHLSFNSIRLFDIGDGFNETIISLDLDSNELKTLPKGIRKLKRLRYLSLLKNDSLDFEHICDVAKDLPNLESLQIMDLKIDSIPPNINNLYKLKFISVASYMMDEKLYNELKSILNNTRFF